MWDRVTGRRWQPGFRTTVGSTCIISQLCCSPLSDKNMRTLHFEEKIKKGGGRWGRSPASTTTITELCCKMWNPPLVLRRAEKKPLWGHTSGDQGHDPRTGVKSSSLVNSSPNVRRREHCCNLLAVPTVMHCENLHERSYFSAKGLNQIEPNHDHPRCLVAWCNLETSVVFPGVLECFKSFKRHTLSSRWPSWWWSNPGFPFWSTGRNFCCFNGLLTGELACTLCFPRLGTVSSRRTICLEVAEVRTSIESCGNNFCVAPGRLSSNLELLSGGQCNVFW